MKRILALLALTFVATGMNAQGNWGSSQEDSLVCFENYNTFGQLAQARQFAQAYDHWVIVYETCPKINETLYKFAPTVIEGKMDAVDAQIQSAADAAQKEALEAEKAALIETLFAQYDKRMEYFPQSAAYVKAAVAQTKYELYGDEAALDVYSLFNEAMEMDPKQMNASHFWSYFRVSVALNRIDSLSLADLFEVYNKIDENVAVNTDALNVQIAELAEQEEAGMLDARNQRVLAARRSSLENYSKVKGNVSISLNSLLTSCDIIARVYNEETFEQNKDNEVWIRRAVRTLGADYQTDSGTVINCRDNPLYFQLTEVLYEMNPSVEAARNMGRLALYREEYAKAVDYFKQAAEGELDPLLRSDDYTSMAQAQLAMGSGSSAKSSVQKAMADNPNNGRAQLILASAYASAAGTCGNDVFEKNAVYWAAISRAQRAKSLDPALASIVNRRVAQWTSALPDKSLSFRLNHPEGSTYTIGCWINETITANWP